MNDGRMESIVSKDRWNGRTGLTQRNRKIGLDTIGLNWNAQVLVS